MTWLSWLGVPSFKGLTEFFYATTHWKEYRERHKELEETFRAISLHREALHELDKEELRRRAARAEAATDLARQIAEQRDQAFAMVDSTVTDLLDVVTALAVHLFYADPDQREATLATLRPSARDLVQHALASLPTASLKALGELRVRGLAQILGPETEQP